MPLRPPDAWLFADRSLTLGLPPAPLAWRQGVSFDGRGDFIGFATDFCRTLIVLSLLRLWMTCSAMGSGGLV
jgi:hypothetical protein